MITEGKTCALQELGVNSRYSSSLATGTGTDQMGLACLIMDGVKPIAGGGHHIKLGQLMGQSVKDAVKEVLIRQNGMTPDRQCSVKIILERFNVRSDGRHRMTSRELVERINKYLPLEAQTLLSHNYLAFFHDPWVAAAASALVHIKDKFTWGILPILMWPEIMGTFGGLLAAAVSGRTERSAHYGSKLSPRPNQTSDEDFLNLAARALAMGLTDKWS
jgi:hypothetical protein